MIKLNKIFWLCPFLLMSSCYQKHLLFRAETVSMTKTNSGKSDLVIGKEISEKWCTSDEVIYTKDGTDLVGMADQAIYKAQGKGEEADFIAEVTVYTDSKGCAIVEGKRAKIRK